MIDNRDDIRRGNPLYRRVMNMSLSVWMKLPFARGYQYCFFYFCLIAYLWYATHPDLTERKFFFNEVFSLIGFFLFLSKPILYKKKDYIYNSVMAILFIFSAYAISSLLIFQNLYGYFRHLVLVYSIFSFFLGIRLFPIIKKVGRRDFLFLSALLPSGDFYRTSYAVSLPLYLSKYSKTFTSTSLVLVASTMVGVTLFYGGSTSIAIIFFLVFLYLLNNQWKIICLFFLLSFLILLFAYMKPYLESLPSRPYGIDDMVLENVLFRIDGNATTRLFMWSYLFYNVFLDNLLGIGLGTVLFPFDFIKGDLNIATIYDPYLEYTLGAHNSFLAILVRFGVLGILPFVGFYWKLINEFIADKKKKDNRLLFFYFAFFMITGSALLNVILESPMHASLYWGTLGILYQAKIESGNAHA